MSESTQHIHVHTFTHPKESLNTHTHTYIYIYVHTRRHTPTHTHRETHAHARANVILTSTSALTWRLKVVPTVGLMGGMLAHIRIRVPTVNTRHSTVWARRTPREESGSRGSVTTRSVQIVFKQPHPEL